MQVEKRFDTGELTISYLETGETGRALVLLHGLTSSKQGYAPVMPLLADRWHLYAPDFRGHGTSDRATDTQYHNVDYARDIISFLKQIGEPVVVIGHSLGAMVAIIVAARYPEGVRGVTLLDPPLFSYMDTVREQPETTKWFELVASVTRDNPSQDVVADRLRKIMPETPPDQLSQMAGVIATTASGAAEIALRDEIWQGVDLPGELEKIRCPVLLIHGDWSAGAAMREKDVAFFTTHCPKSTVVHLPGANHGLGIRENPDILVRHFNATFPS